MNDLMNLSFAPSRFLKWSELFVKVSDKNSSSLQEENNSDNDKKKKNKDSNSVIAYKQNTAADIHIDFFGKAAAVRVYSFDTWMNMFAAKKWHKYCDLGNIYLRLNIKGKYILQIYGTSFTIAFGAADNLLIEKEVDGENNIEVLIPSAQNYEGLFFKIIEDKNEPIEIISANWATDKTANYDNKLALVSCTYKREEYIGKTIKVFQDFIKANPSLKSKIHFFVVDNGKTLDTNLSNDIVTIVPNINAGGAGGFTRGLIEAIKSDFGFTRVLFMDDDVEVLPESFYRTLILSNYLKEEFKSSFINGAMMDYSDRYNLFENLAYRKDFWVKPYYSGYDIRHYDNILIANHIPDEVFNDENKKAFSGWWYHCFDINIVKEKGLPLPLFIRGDDIEWGWRHFGKHHISMNGISVWHPSFKWRVSNAMDFYYSSRNIFIDNIIHTKNFKRDFVRLMSNNFKYLIKTYSYVNCGLSLKAMDDILSRGAFFRENPQEILKSVSALGKVEYHNCDNLYELWEATKYKRKLSFGRRIIYYLTNRALFCPQMFMRKRCIALEWYPPAENFIMVREIKVYNTYTNKYEIRRFDRRKIRYYRKQFNAKLKAIENNYDKLKDEYLKIHKEVTTMDFWEKYLKLK